MVLGLGTLAALSAQAASQGSRTPAVTLFEGARLIVGDGSTPIDSSAFIVDNGKFTRIGRKGELQLPTGGVRVDFTGKTVMPAVVDLHTHVGWVDLRSSSHASDRYTREILVDHLQRYAYYGVAAVLGLDRDPGELPFQVREEQIPNAALFRTASRGFETPDRGGPAGRGNVPYAVTSEAEARKGVRELAAKKAAMVKIWVDDRGGAVRKLPPDLYRAIIDEAHKNNLHVVAHIFSLADAKELLRSEIDGFAHGVRDVDIDDEFITLLKQRPNVFFGPNLPSRGLADDLAWLNDTVPPEEIKRMRDAVANRKPDAVRRQRESFGLQARNLAKLSAAGVRIGFGTDGTGAGWTAHVELADMVTAGMTPAQVIVAATRNSAQILGLDQLGTVAGGKSADFIVLNANPLDDITNTRRIARVYLRGQEVDRTALKSALTGSASQ